MFISLKLLIYLCVLLRVVLKNDKESKSYKFVTMLFMKNKKREIFTIKSISLAYGKSGMSSEEFSQFWK